MSRRGLALLTAWLLAFGLGAGASVARVPYVALGAGPTYDTLGQVAGTPVIEITGRRTYATEGRLELTTVGVDKRLTLAEALRDWLDSRRAVVPREAVYRPGRTDDEVDAENAALMTSSQSSATTAALRQLRIPVVSEVVVAAVGEGTPAEGRLRAGDVVRAVDGRPVRDTAELRRLVSDREPGQPVQVSYVREGAEAGVRLVTAASDTDPARAVIGVEPQDRIDPPFEVRISLEEVGGPSAGLMFALGIVDKLEAGSLTGGAHVAGTGAILPDGTVQPVGGIPLKLLGARREGASVFLVPAGNCAEAVETQPEGLALARVGTLRDALVALEAVRAGTPVPSCQDATAAGR